MSRPHVTITLGRSGQVVKRPAPVSDGTRSDQPLSSSGSKRSVRERLGSNLDNPKRQRRESGNWSPSGNDIGDNKQIDARVGRDDLRYKLMRKSMSKRTKSDVAEQNSRDLREKLTRTVQSPMSINRQQHMPEPLKTGISRRIPPTRSADDLTHVNSLKNTYSPWTLDGLRRRSPDRNLGTSRGLSPPRSMNELRQVPSIRSADTSRPSTFMRKDVNAPRSIHPTYFPTKTAVPPEAAKPVVRVPPPSGLMPKSAYMGVEPATVSSLLHSLGLDKYAILFQAEEVDMTALKQMGDNDLKDLGIPMGPRKKILLSVMPRAKRQP